MNDLNALVSHALSAVRDAQQSVSEGNMLAGEDAQPLLPGFSDMMQGLIALAQTAPQTEDAFETAQVAMLQNMVDTDEEGQDPALDLMVEDEDQEDGAAEMLLDAQDTPAPLTQDPLALAFAPLQETIASMLLGQAQAASAQDDAASGASAMPSMAAGLPQAAAIAQAEARAAQDAQQAVDAQGSADGVQHPAAASLQQAQAAQALQAEAATPGQDAQARMLQASTGNEAMADASKVADARAPGAADSAQAVQSAPASIATAPVVAVAPQPEPAPISVSADAREAAARAQSAAAADPVTTAQAAGEIAPLASRHDDVAASGKADDTQATQATTDTVVAPPTSAVQAPKPSQDTSREDAPKSDARSADAASSAQTQRPKSTLAETRAARHVQNYQAMTEQAPAPASSQPSAPAAGVQFTPAAAVTVPATDPTSPTVQLPGVTLPNLPADLSNALAAGAKRVRIEINPPSLGHVEVGVHMRDGAVFVSMQAENSNVAQHIERHLQDLRANLKEAGLSLGGFEMSSRGDASGQHAAHSGTSQERLWTDDMLQLAVEPGPAPIEEIVAPAVSQHRPGGINVVA